MLSTTGNLSLLATVALDLRITLLAVLHCRLTQAFVDSLHQPCSFTSIHLPYL